MTTVRGFTHKHKLLDEGYAFSDGIFRKIIYNDIRDICLDKHGNLYFVVDSSLIKMTPGREISTIYDKFIHPVKCLVTKDGIIFVVDKVHRDTHLHIPRKCVIKRIVENVGYPTSFIELSTEPVDNVIYATVKVYHYWPTISSISSYSPGKLLIANSIWMHILTYDPIIHGSASMQLSEPKFMGRTNERLISACVNHRGNIFTLYNNGNMYCQEEFNSHANIKAEYVTTMTADDLGNIIYIKENGNVHIFPASQIELTPYFIGDIPDVKPTMIDGTGFYIVPDFYSISSINNTIEKMYLDNVKWKQGLHNRLAPFLQEQVETILMLEVRTRRQYTQRNIFGGIPKDVLFVICSFLCITKDSHEEDSYSSDEDESFHLKIQAFI